MERMGEIFPGPKKAVFSLKYPNRGRKLSHTTVLIDSWLFALSNGLNIWCFHIFQIDKQQFEETVRTLNNLYAEAEKLGSQSYIEGCLACLTAYTVFLCMETHYEKVRDSLHA